MYLQAGKRTVVWYVDAEQKARGEELVVNILADGFVSNGHWALPAPRVTVRGHAPSTQRDTTIERLMKDFGPREAATASDLQLQGSRIVKVGSGAIAVDASYYDQLCRLFPTPHYRLEGCLATPALVWLDARTGTIGGALMGIQHEALDDVALLQRIAEVL